MMFRRRSQWAPAAFPGSNSHRGRRRARVQPAVLRASHGLPLPLPPPLLLLLLLLVVGLQGTAVAYRGTENGDNAKASGLQAQDGSVLPSARRLLDSPDVTFDADNDGGGVGGGSGEQEGVPASLVQEEDTGEAEGSALDASEGDASGEPLAPEESAGALLADGEPRCFYDDGRRLLCLPTLFFLGVSKCGTTSFTEWMSHHPLIRWVRRPQHLYYLEAHVFDIPARAAEWRRSAASPSSSPRDRLAVEAHEGDTVVDYTPNYSLVAEVPYRISDVYGRGALRERGLKFLVLLREPVARTVSSWEYKTNPELAARVAAATHPEVLLASLAGRAVELRPLEQAVEEGVEMVTRLSACVANATAAEGGYGRGGHEVTLCGGHSASVTEAHCEDGRHQERNQDREGAGGAARRGDQDKEKGQEEGCERAPCERFVEPWCNPVDFLESNLYDAHVGKSMYALQLARWFAVFGRENFKVIFTEDMAEDPMRTLEDVFGFLGIDFVDPEGAQGLRSLQEWEDIVRIRSNEADPDKKAKLAPQVTPGILESLRDFFAPHNAALEELLGVPVPAGWSTGR